MSTDRSIESHTGDFGRGAARWHCLDSAGPPLNFQHANGLPFPTYKTFLELLASDYRVCGMDNRGAWPNVSPPARGYNWQHHADDLIAFFEHHYDEPVNAVGHSIGGSVSLFAAIRRPELFRSLVLIDAATSPNRFWNLVVRLTPKALSGRVPIIRKTRNRRRHWDSREQFIDHHKTRRAYKDFTKAAFSDYANGGLEETDDGRFRLMFSPDWEAYNFQTTPYTWDALAKVTVPTLLLSAEHTYLHDHAVLLHHAKRFSPSVEYRILEGLHHLAPQQDPETVATIIRDWLPTSRTSDSSG